MIVTNLKEPLSQKKAWVVERASVVEGTIPLEGTIDEEITVDAEDTNDEISTAFTAAVSASGVLGAWHSGCRGPSPLVEAWVV